MFEQAEAAAHDIQKQIESPQKTKYIFGMAPRILKYSDVFPLVELEFEGKKFFAPHRWHKLLTTYYGDYITPQVTHTHLDFDRLTERDRSELLKIKTLEERVL